MDLNGPEGCQHWIFPIHSSLKYQRVEKGESNLVQEILHRKVCTADYLSSHLSPAIPEAL